MVRVRVRRIDSVRDWVAVPLFVASSAPSAVTVSVSVRVRLALREGLKLWPRSRSGSRSGLSDVEVVSGIEST